MNQLQAQLSQLRFQTEEVGDKLTAVFNGEPEPRASLLSRFLLPSTSFVIGVLNDIARIEDGIDSTYAWENPEVYVELFPDRMTIEPYAAGTEEELPRVELGLDEVKLLLFEWGAALQRCLIGRGKG